MNSIVITGCNRGIGLGLVRHLVKDKISPKSLLATCRNVENAEELQQIAAENKNVHILQLEVDKPETFEDFARRVEDIVKDDGLNVLFNNAGYSPKSTRINFVKPEQMMETFLINSVGPLMLTKTLLPLLKKAASKNVSKPVGIHKSAVINMSSYLGSLSLNNQGGLYPYRCSKVALNMITKSLSVDFKNDGILVTSIHPGWVKTSMGGSNAPLDIDTSVCGIIELLKNLNDDHNGQFYCYDGSKMDW
ncbi:C-factor [Diabrotica virgifera virgifera]|uniref:C-factor-like n=1 Tax=Diabrotica virgifera virgifera TaxID=50390 RepID=A0ABM5L7C7_DIAVI|nr:C-factor [Diabrotica virgifera virgifera]